jgi:hypothetical protein
VRQVSFYGGKLKACLEGMAFENDDARMIQEARKICLRKGNANFCPIKLRI